jgi:ribonuclease BN (tRNA processing enzyme)
MLEKTSEEQLFINHDPTTDFGVSIARTGAPVDIRVWRDGQHIPASRYADYIQKTVRGAKVTVTTDTNPDLRNGQKTIDGAVIVRYFFAGSSSSSGGGKD